MISYGFFNSVNGDRLYNADDISNYFLKLISNGVFATPSNSMQVVESSGMNVDVTAGWGFINCKWLKNDAMYNLPIDAADIVLNRIDRVVMRLNADSSLRNMELAIIKGTPAANPTAPALTRVTGGVWELSLASIYVGANVTAITQANITDERPDANLCGWVTGLIDQIDTTNLFAQFTAAFWDWFNGIKDQVLRNTLVRRYTTRIVSTENPQSTFSVNIEQYNPSLDILNVYVNGMRLQPGIDYTVSGTNVTLTNPVDVIGTPIDFEIFKSIDGSDAESITVLVDQLSAQVTNLTNKFTTQVGDYVIWAGTETEYTEIDPKDANTIYHVTEDTP